MKFIILFFICTSALANCDGLKEAIELCRIYECKLQNPEIGMKLSYKVNGFKDDVCIVEFISPNPFGSGELDQICHYHKSSLSLAAEMNWLPITQLNSMMKSMEDLDSKDSNPSTLLEDSQNDAEIYMKKTNDLQTKVLNLHDGKNPCSPKDAKTTGIFTEKMQEIAKAIKPLTAISQRASKSKISKLFPDDGPSCILSTNLQNLEQAERIQNTRTIDDCKKFQNSKCSELFNLANFRKLSCPSEINLLWATPRKDVVEDKVMIYSEIISSKVCEVNGIVREEKKLTYDHEFKTKINRYCEGSNGYNCQIRIFTEKESVELEQTKEVIRDRDGAEVKCLKIAKKLAKPHCESKKSNLVCEISVSVKDRTDPAANLFMHSFLNFCNVMEP